MRLYTICATIQTDVWIRSFIVGKRSQKKTQLSSKGKSNSSNRGSTPNNSSKSSTLSLVEIGCIVLAFAFGSFILGLCFYQFWANIILSISGVSIILSKFIPPLDFLDRLIKNTKVRQVVYFAIAGIAIGTVLTVSLRPVILSDEDDVSTLPPEVEEFSSDTAYSETDAPIAPDDILGNMPIDSLRDDTDIANPEVIISAANNYTAAEKFSPSETVDALIAAIDPGLPVIMPKRTVQTKQDCIEAVYNKIKNNLGIENQPADATVNGNVEFAKLTAAANYLEASEDIVITLDVLKEITQAREDANAIISTSGIRSRLSDNYHQLARFYRQQEMWEDAYSYYLNAISMNAQYLHLHTAIDDDFYAHFYRIALLYQCIGDIPALDLTYRLEAYYLSACFFETASRNAYEGKYADYGFLSSYYAGMVNHKLLILEMSNKNSNASYYAVDAYAYYLKSLDFTEYRKQRSFQYQFLSQICERAMQCIQRYGRVDGMLSYPQYKEKSSEYRSLSR